MSRETWDERWMGMARHVATFSKDRSRKTGCCVVSQDNIQLTFGWNGFPRNINDDISSRHIRPSKYLWTEHGERNAIYNAAKKGIALEGAKIYIDWYPCGDCARAIVQSGIVEVIGIEPDWSDPRYADDFKFVKELFEECGVTVRFLDGEAPVQKEIS
jgi:dCMP deaminase